MPAQARPRRRATATRPPRGFDARTLAAIHRDRILGIRAGTRPHRFIGVWVVVAERRVFVRSWSVKPDGWFRTFAAEPVGAVQVGGRTLAVRVVRTRSERLKAAVDRAYRDKYKTPGALRYVADLCRAKSKATTTELVPIAR